jgi:stage V sporulation protein G
LTEKDGKRLRAYATITFDDSFVVRNIKVVDGNSGLFIAMPARKIKQFCSKCGKKVDIGSRYCNHCGGQFPMLQVKDENNTKQLTHQDLAHPINQEFRDYLQNTILEAYYAEKSPEGDIQRKSPVKLADRQEELDAQ